MTKPVKITLIHATWCGHCVNFMKIWEPMTEKKNEGEKGYDEYLNKHKNIDFVTYEESELTKDNELKNKVRGYPTILIEINGNEKHYTGPRQESDILEFIRGEIKSNITGSKSESKLESESESTSDTVLSSDSEKYNKRGGNKTVKKLTDNDLKIQEINNLSDMLRFE